MAGPDSAVKDSNACKVSNADEVERNIISENIDFVEEFLRNVKKRGNDLPMETKNKLERFRKDWSGFFNTADTGKLKSEHNTGTKPKVKLSEQKKGKKIYVKQENSGTENTMTSDDTESDTDTISERSSSEEERIEQKKKVKKNKIIKKKDHSTVDSLIRALDKLDMRQVPTIEMFDENSGQDLKNT